MTDKKAALAVRVTIDALLITLAFVLSYLVRYQLEWPYPVEEQYYAPFMPYIPYTIILNVLCLLMFGLNGLYAPQRRRRVTNQLFGIVNGTATSIVILMALTFGLQPLVYSRGMMILAGVLIVFFLSVFRLIDYLFVLRQRRRKIGVARVLVVGIGEVGLAVIRTILADPMLGYHVVGYLDDDPAKGNGLGRIKSLGSIDKMANIIKEEKVDIVIVALPWMYHRKIMQIIETCEVVQAQVRVVPDVFQRSLRSIDLDSLNGIPLMSPVADRLTPGGRIAKRTIDLVLSLLAILVLIIIFPVIALLIRIDSKGPIFYRQERVGMDGKRFMFFKFRTMIEGADQLKDQVAHLSKYQGDTLLKVPNDPRMTRVGRLLRRFSIDELPQIVNVLRGEMSWVGPRPNTPDEVSKYEPWQRKRLSVLPGITGLWQVSGRSDIPFAEMCLLDIFYIEDWSLSLDLRILLQTIPHVIFGNGAY